MNDLTESVDNNNEIDPKEKFLTNYYIRLRTTVCLPNLITVLQKHFCMEDKSLFNIQ